MPPLSPPSRPVAKRPVRELLIEAYHDVSTWDTTQDGKALTNPNDNISRNTAWVFPGHAHEPLVACIWYQHLKLEAARVYYLGNDRAYRQRLLNLDKGEARSAVRSRLHAWTKRSRDLDMAIQAAYKLRRPIRLILVDGDSIDETVADRAATVSARALDTAIWWVHEYDFDTGGYRLVRDELPPPQREADDETPAIPDLGDDPLLQALVADLSDTEREAVIRARIGQGPFRDALFARWEGCSVTDVKLKDLLTASHIKPWSLCDTAAERVNVCNGLLLTPTLDRLFDRGLIAFDQRFKIRISSKVNLAHQGYLGVTPNTQLRLRHFDDLQPFLAWHEQFIFQP